MSESFEDGMKNLQWVHLDTSQRSRSPCSRWALFNLDKVEYMKKWREMRSERTSLA